MPVYAGMPILLIAQVRPIAEPTLSKSPNACPIMYTVSAVLIKFLMFSAARRILTLPVLSFPGEIAPKAVKPFDVFTSAWSPPR